MLRTCLALSLLGGCQPMMGGPLPLPLGAGHTSSIELSTASPRAPALRDAPPSALREPPLPRLQLHAASTFTLTDEVEAGPAFLLDIGDRGEPGAVSGGFFLRLWATDEERSDLLAAVRVEAGWAWAGLGVDLILPASEEAFVSLSPTVQATPSMLTGRLPVGVWLRLDPVDVGLEGGLTAGTALTRPHTPAVVPWLGLRARLSL